MHSVLTNVYKTEAQDMDTYYYLRQRLSCCDVEGKKDGSRSGAVLPAREKREEGWDVRVTGAAGRRTRRRPRDSTAADTSAQHSTVQYSRRFFIFLWPEAEEREGERESESKEREQRDAEEGKERARRGESVAASSNRAKV
jgi:hypothetical protein